ncbi:MAG: hypothetical protein KHF84_07365 [Thermoplasmata archaeon]|nr:hypothetical protein [Candidatus Sysuiplasma jiujiangense]
MNFVTFVDTIRAVATSRPKIPIANPNANNMALTRDGKMWEANRLLATAIESVPPTEYSTIMSGLSMPYLGCFMFELFDENDITLFRTELSL